MLGAEGIRMAPNVSATKVAWLLDQFVAQGREDAELPGVPDV